MQRKKEEEEDVKQEHKKNDEEKQEIQRRTKTMRKGGKTIRLGIELCEAGEKKREEGEGGRGT